MFEIQTSLGNSFTKSVLVILPFDAQSCLLLNSVRTCLPVARVEAVQAVNLMSHGTSSSCKSQLELEHSAIH